MDNEMIVLGIKRQISKVMLRIIRSSMLADSSSLSYVLWRAKQARYGEIPEEEFCQSLEKWFNENSPSRISELVNLGFHVPKLLRAGGYKSYVMELAEPRAKLFSFIWDMRVRLLMLHGISVDVMILRRGKSIPPHGHNRVVSGFYILKGKVGLKNFEVVDIEQAGLLITKVFDGEISSGQYTVNGSCRPNIHWLEGDEEISLMLRINIKGVPSVTGPEIGERIYINPCLNERGEAPYFAPFISEEEAKAIVMGAEDLSDREVVTTSDK